MAEQMIEEPFLPATGRQFPVLDQASFQHAHPLIEPALPRQADEEMQMIWHQHVSTHRYAESNLTILGEFPKRRVNSIGGQYRSTALNAHGDEEDGSIVSRKYLGQPGRPSGFFVWDLTHAKRLTRRRAKV